MRRQQGNALVWVILAVIAAGIAGVIVWRYITTTQVANQQAGSGGASTGNSQQSTSVSSRTTISEWGVSFGVPNGLAQQGVTIEYQPSVNGKPDAVYYRSSTLSKADNNCYSDPGYQQPFYVIGREKKNDQATRNLYGIDSNGVKQIGSWYYYVARANIKGCYDTSVVQPFLDDSAYKITVQSIQGAQ